MVTVRMKVRVFVPRPQSAPTRATGTVCTGLLLNTLVTSRGKTLLQTLPVSAPHDFSVLRPQAFVRVLASA
eukprot:3579999-Alexandrium_andersonii.AAC.1